MVCFQLPAAAAGPAELLSFVGMGLHKEPVMTVVSLG